MRIMGKTIFDVWKSSVRALLSLDELVPTDRNLDTYECQNAVLEIFDPLSDLDDLLLFEKQRNKDYLSASIREYWEQVKKRTTKLFRTSRISINQYDIVRTKLENNPFSRHGYISVWSPFEDLDSSYPTCLIGLYFVVRNDRLNMTAILRSNDSWGQALNDMYELVMIQKHMAKDLGLEIGIYTHVALSYHLYIKDKIDAMMTLGDIVHE